MYIPEMSRRSSRRRTVIANYRLLNDRGTTIASNAPNTTPPTVADAQTPNAAPDEQTPDTAPAEQATPPRRRSQRQVVISSPPLEHNEVSCSSCKMRFTDAAGAQVKHNRHHPNCVLFERATPYSDPTTLSFNSLLHWMRSLKVPQIKEQLVLYFQKTSGNKQDLLNRLEEAVRAPPVDISVGSQHHQDSFSAEQLRNMCKAKFLNHLHTSRGDLYKEYFGVKITNTVNVAPTEIEEERQDRLMVNQKNRESFDIYVKNKVMDAVDQQLYHVAEVPDTTAFNPHLYRPDVSKDQFISAMLSLGVERSAVDEMTNDISSWPVDRRKAKEICCLRSCEVCS